MDKLDELKHDPQEDDPKKGPIIKEAAEQAKQKILGKGQHNLGDAHRIWAEQKKILKERGINWKSPQEMNPCAMLD